MHRPIDPAPTTLRDDAHAFDADEANQVRRLAIDVPDEVRARAVQDARALVDGARRRVGERTHLDSFLQQFGLSNTEGVALMCLAEALLRVPDARTADDLIAEKLALGDWGAHAGRSDSLFVNASTWGLMLTGRWIGVEEAASRDPGRWLRGLVQRVGEPIVRQAVRRALAILADEFVVGRTIDEALARSRSEPELALCSYDMLGEGARTAHDADRYLDAYRAAIDAVGAGGSGRLHDRSAVSVKLSALDPRYSLLQRRRVATLLTPRVLALARAAAARGIGLTVDAEEADRLEISLEVIAALIADAATRDWPGLSVAVQAYGRRAPAVIDWLIDRTRAARRRITVRLVKGAYWDTEIKRAQERGLVAFPVYTRKASTDVAYLSCARRLLDAASSIRPQFATHNALTIAAVRALRPDPAGYEFQRLHGMGALLYREAQRRFAPFPPVRVYAPVGSHANLLGYLVRRLLENGANTSFVNRFLDERVPVETLVQDPVGVLRATPSISHPQIARPRDLYGAARRNSLGVDFGRAAEIAPLYAAVDAIHGSGPAAGRATDAPMPSSPPDRARGTSSQRALDATWTICNPADRREPLGEIGASTAGEIDAAFEAAAAAQRDWDARGGRERAAVLEAAADALEAARERLAARLVLEAGKTMPDAVAEVREAADFARYYAAEARRLFDRPHTLTGPTGESNQLTLQGRGVLACISPWNFPLAIFCGQVVAALAAGNAVVAKPAEATPLIARDAVALLHGTGVPREVLQLVIAEGPAFGAVALAHRALSGVVFTGSTRTGSWLNRTLAARDGPILPLIAETGGLNAMIVDSSALLEQVTDDVIASAFGSAGQRCSALRLLFVQADVADALLDMLRGAMDVLVVGDPADPATDVGPVISARARDELAVHVERMRREARIVHAGVLDERHRHGTFFAPHLIELTGPAQLTSEQFGPILHLVRFERSALASVLEAVRSSGYRLTLGVHSRLESFWREVLAHTAAGNTYVNRNMIGAVVGVQPFGGSGLSGTGPKAGGPHYLVRLADERTLSVNTTATGGNTGLLTLE